MPRTSLAALTILLASCQLLLVTDQRRIRRSDASAPTAEADGGELDAELEGGSDASDSDATVIHACPATFCDDFESPALGALWDKTAANGGALLTIEPDAGVGGAALHSSSASDGALAYLAKSFPTTKRHIVVTFDMRLAERDATLDLVSVGYPTFENWVNVSVIGGIVRLEACNSTQGCSNVAIEKTPDTSFHRYRLELDVATTAASVALDGLPAANVTAPSAAATDFALDFGLSYVAGASGPGASVFFDNLIVAIDP